jgi:hypothetical protein
MSDRAKWAVAVGAIGVLVASGAADAAVVATYYLDFGHSSITTTTSNPSWTNVTSNTATALVNSGGVASPTATVRAQDWFSTGSSGPSAGMTGTTPGTAAYAFGGAHPNAASDYMYDQDATVNGVPVPAAFKVTFANLDPTLAYAFTIFASRNQGGERQTDYTATGTASKSGTLNPSNNTANIAVLDGLRPDATKAITLNVTKNAANTAGTVFLNAVKLEASTVPEPASLAAGAAALGLLARRRRKSN